MVKQIESKYAFQEALNGAGDKLVVVDFSATWCGPCKMIKPFFHSLSEKYSNVVFLEVDVDDCQPGGNGTWTGLERLRTGTVTLADIQSGEEDGSSFPGGCPSTGKDVASECEVKCMPTFQFFKKGQKVGEFSGANKEKLEATINELI